MRNRHETSSSSSKPNASAAETTANAASAPGLINGTQRRSELVWLILFGLIIYSSWTVYDFQFQRLPFPLTADQAGKRGFSEVEAIKHVVALTHLGPHPVASTSLDLAVEYVLAEAEKIKKTAHWEVDVEVDLFHAKSGANRMVSGLFKGKTLVYSDLNHVVLRILPKYALEAGESAILVSSHVDTVFSTEGAGDCSSCVAVMLELARGISQWGHGFKNGIIFLFNTGEEEGLSGAHSFITQHPWSKTIRMAIDLEAMGIGGPSGIFQAGPHPWAIENFALAAKYPSGHILAQDLFSSGVIKSATDFQVYKEVAGLSGLDFAYTDNGAVYHTKNDKLELLKPGSLQHLGENMLAFLLQIAPKALPTDEATGKEGRSGHDTVVFFDILGKYMVIYNQRFADMLHNSVIIQSLLIWTTSLLMGGYPAIFSLGLSCLSAVLTLVFSITFSVLVAFLLPQIFPSPVPYVANPWLVVGLFAAPALIGALTGQHFGYIILKKYLSNVYSKRKELSSVVQADLVKLEAERWLFKAGFVLWLILLSLGHYYKIGSSYIALSWLVPPAFAYGLLEATLTPARFPRPLKLATLLMGLAVPIIISAGTFIRLTSTLIGMMVRIERNPGSSPEWMGNIMISVFVAVIVGLTLIYILSYVHLSGAKRSIIFATSLLFGLSLIFIYSGILPPFTEDASRAVNVVHVVDATGSYGSKQDARSYVYLFSVTPGKLTKEAEQINEGFSCGRGKVVDFVSFTAEYGCWTQEDMETKDGWSDTDIPTMHVDSDVKVDKRVTQVSIDTKASVRWSLAINTEHIEDYTFTGNSEELVPFGNKTSVDGWHIIQFAGGRLSPRKFVLTLQWANKSMKPADDVASGSNKDQQPLLKLRTDIDEITPKAERVLEKLPKWCSQFGKSSSPYNLAFLSSLPVNF
ncbi:Vacuolar membrane protease [Euphorbia peplus]|nr:Vacuolar membrane protease [Euphorbia peplus]